MDIFLQAFGSTFLSMLKIFLVVLGAGILLRKKVLTQDHLKGLSAATVDVFLPCMSFTNILAHFHPGQFSIWWVLPLAGIGITALGMVIGILFFFREFPAKRNMVALCGVQNGAFLILPLGAVLLADRFEQFSVYVFLFTTGQSIIIWTVGKQLVTASAKEPLRFRDLLTPPIFATVLAIICVMTGVNRFFLADDLSGTGPVTVLCSSLFGAMQLIGAATTPLAIFTLGGVLGGIAIRFQAYLFDLFRFYIVKFLLVPIVTILLVLVSGIGQTNPLLALFFVIESSSAPAIMIALQVKKYGGDEQKIASILMTGYLACLVMMPFWVAICTLFVLK